MSKGFLDSSPGEAREASGERSWSGVQSVGQRAGFPGSSWDPAEKGRVSLRAGLAGACSIWRRSIGKRMPTLEVKVMPQSRLGDADTCE